MNIKTRLFIAFIISVISFVGCNDDACKDVKCEYDGFCEEGDCYCGNTLTNNYIIGQWKPIVSFAPHITFTSDFLFYDSVGNNGTWQIDSLNRNLITLSNGQEMNITLFSCTDMFIEDWEPISINAGITYDRR